MRLRGGVASHETKIADEDRLGIPDLDESVNQDRIRNRIEPPADLVSGREIFKVETVKQPEGDYEKDQKKLKTFTPNQLDKLLTGVEKQSKEGKGSFSKGNLLNGYAIDPETLNSLQTTVHQGTEENLAIEMENKMDIENFDENTEIQLKRRIIGGFVYLEVPCFKTPIVKLWSWEHPEEDVKRIANHIKKERKFLPIDSFFKVL